MTATVAPRLGDARLAALVEASFGGEHESVVRIVRRPSSYGSTASLEEVDVVLENGSTLPLMVKDLRPSSVLSAARQARPDALVDPAREPQVYAHLLAPAGLGARSIAAVADDAAGEYVVVLERVRGLQLCHVGSHLTWAAAARWLARLHTRQRDAALDAAKRGVVRLLVVDEAGYRRWLVLAAARVAAVERDRARRRAFDRLAAGYDGIVTALAAETSTLLHGECYASNVIVREPPVGAVDAICPVDWEMAAIGPAAFDLAALTSGDWTSRERRRLLVSYQDELMRLGTQVRPLAELEAIVDCCRIHLAVQLLAWHRNWTPPREQARDWLGEAIAIVAHSPARAYLR